MNAKGTHTISAFSLSQTSSEWLPKKYSFEVSGRDIKISRKNFSMICKAICVDAPDSLSSKHFLICLTIKEEKASIAILSTDTNDEENILVDCLTDFFYTNATLRAGFIAIRFKEEGLGWKLFSITGEHKHLPIIVDSFLETEELPDDRLEMFLKSKQKWDIRYNGASGKILEMLFTGIIFWSSRLLVFNNKTYVIAYMKDGVNILELENKPLRLLEKGVTNIELLNDQIEPPDYNCSYFHCAISIYKQLMKAGVECIAVLSGESGMINYFNFVEKRHLSLSEAEKLDKDIEKYKEELGDAEDFDL